MPEALPTTEKSASGPPAHFKRVLSRGDLIIYGLVILTPTAPYPVFGIVQQNSHGHAALSYLVAMVAMLFTAASYGKMATAFPVAGSTYSFAQRALNEHVGFVAGWAMILDYFLIPLLSVVYVALTMVRLVPHISYELWAAMLSVAITLIILHGLGGIHVSRLGWLIVLAAFLWLAMRCILPIADWFVPRFEYYLWAGFVTLALTLINLYGIRVTTRASTVMMLIMSGCAVLFIWLAARWLILGEGMAGLFSLPGIFRPETFSLPPLMLGAGIATLSYIGFDAISTLAEDTVHPQRDIPFSTVLVCVLQTIICVVTVYLAALVWPDYNTFQDKETVILDLGRRVGGEWMFAFVTVVLVVAGLASALTGQAGASRLLFGMGRDGVISKRIFGYLEPRHSTPTRGIYVMGAVALLGAAVAHFQLVAELLNFGAFVGFILVNLSVIRHYYFRLRQRQGAYVITNLIFPLLGAVVCSYVWMSLTKMAKIVGFSWLGIGLVYLAVLTRGFRVKPKSLGSLNEGATDGT